MKKILSLLMLLVAIVTGAKATGYTPTADEVIILNDVKTSTSPYSSHAAIAWGGSPSSSSKTAGDPSKSGASTSSLSCFSAKGNGGAKNITISISGVSKIIVYHESHAERYIELRNGSKSGSLIGNGSVNTYYTEVDLDVDTDYSIFLHGTKGTDDQDLYVYAVKLIVPSAPAKAYTVTAASNNTNYGTAASSASSLDKDETATITATPKAGYEFTSWSVEGTGATLSSTTTNPTTLTMGTANATVTATFSAINYAITHNDATGGTYTISVAGGEAVSTNTTATIGQTITLAGTPTDPAQTYIRWNVTDADNNPVAVTNNEFTMPAKDVTISPVFSKPLNTLFSMTDITAITNDTENAKYGTVTATISDGGSVDVFNNKGDADGLLYNDNSINLNGSGSNYIHITFPTKLVEGDEISATFLADDQDWKISKTTSGAAAKTNPYTLTANDAFIGATELYIFKNNSAQITELYVKGDGQISDMEVTSSTTPVVAIGAESTIEYTTSSTGAITFVSSDESVATVSSTGVITGVAGGSATITLNQAADDTYRAGVANVTVTVPEVALFKIKILGGTSTSKTGTIDVATAVTADVNVSSNRKMDKGKYAGFTLNGDYSLKAGDIVDVNITAAGQAGTFKFYNNTSDEPTLLYDTEVAPEEAKTYRFVMPAEMEGVKTVYLRRGGDDSGINEGFNPVLGYIAVYRPNAVVTLNAKGFATYSSSYDFEYIGADAYGMELTATSLSGTKVTTGKIKAGEGILFKGEAGAKVAITETTGAEALENNSLIGTTDINNEVISPLSYAYKYALSGDTFKKLTGALVANKAFFGTNEELSNSLDLVFDGATAINNVNANDNANSVAPVKVIKNGQLYIGNYNVAGARIK